MCGGGSGARTKWVTKREGSSYRVRMKLCERLRRRITEQQKREGWFTGAEKEESDNIHQKSDNATAWAIWVKKKKNNK